MEKNSNTVIINDDNRLTNISGTAKLIIRLHDEVEVRTDTKSIIHLLKDLLIPQKISNYDEIIEIVKLGLELKDIKENNIGDFSDGYHTFNELYHHRAVLFATICNQNPELAWKSKQHDDPEFPMYEGMFIVGIETPEGQATYHYDINLWDIFKVKELERAPKYDGHTPSDAIHRIGLLGGFSL